MQAAYDNETTDRPVEDEDHEWIWWTPAPLARTPLDVYGSILAAHELMQNDDPRLSTLGTGAAVAVRWTSAGGEAPVSRRQTRVPTMRDIGQEVSDAGGGVYGANIFKNDWARITVRGVQEWLAWAYLPRYPTPVWLVVDADPDEIRQRVLGQVGLGPGGMHGPHNGLPFVYDVGDWIAEATPRLR
jgi:hypothetical protein